MALPPWQAMSAPQVARWHQVLDTLAGLVAPPRASVVVDGSPAHAATLADRLADTLRARGRPATRATAVDHELAGPIRRNPPQPAHDQREVVVADGAAWRHRAPAGGWDVVVFVRASRGDGHDDHENGADVVLDLHDPGWPMIRHVTPRLAFPDDWYVAESRAFFGIRAAGWDTRFGDDLPAYAAAVTEACLPPGEPVLDVGCGTGRALGALRAAVGPGAPVVGVDLTPEMLAVARASNRHAESTLVLGDARRLPVADGSVGAVFAAGLVAHLPDVRAGFGELARVTRAGGRLVVFHPSGRAALAARHGRTLRADETLAQPVLGALLDAAGWSLERYDDPPHRFLAVATRH